MLDAALDAAILLIAARFEGRWLRPWRLFFGALIGAGAAWAARVLALSRGQTALLWLPAAYLMALAAQGRRAAAHPVRCVCLLLCAAGLLGGTLTALCGAMGSLLSAYALGSVLMIGMTACLLRVRRAAQGVRRVSVACRWRGHTVRFEAMVDSGNTLRDYLTHYPVIVLPERAGRRIFRLEGEMLRPIFADTAGGRQWMHLLVPQETIVQAGKERRSVHAAVALCGALGADAPALVPAALMDEENQA